MVEMKEGKKQGEKKAAEGTNRRTDWLTVHVQWNHKVYMREKKAVMVDRKKKKKKKKDNKSKRNKKTEGNPNWRSITVPIDSQGTENTHTAVFHQIIRPDC